VARDFSKIACVLAVAFSMSAHCERGILQLLTYEYIRGFSLTSDVCPSAATADIPRISVNAINASVVFLITVAPLLCHPYFESFYWQGPAIP